MAKVHLRNVSKLYGNNAAVATMNLDINDGEFLVLVGPSGCGKTTTLRMIAGLEEPTDGEIYIGERNVTYVEPKDRDIAMVFQNYALYPHMTVYNNMAYSLRLRKIPKETINKRIDDTAQMLGIKTLLDRYPRQLSGGQQQRVALGRAIVRNSTVFLMDEPLSNLDAKLRVQTRAELIKLHQQLKTTIIYVTHDQVEAMTMGTRIVVMKDGFIQQVGHPLEIYHQPSNMFVASFVGSPPMQFFYGTLAKINNTLSFQGNGIQLALPDLDQAITEQDVVLGIRPENLALTTDSGNSSLTIACKIEVVENIGAEALIHAQTIGDEQIVIRLSSPKAIPQPGTIVNVSPTQGNLHLFNATTGDCLATIRVNDNDQDSQ